MKISIVGPVTLSLAAAAALLALTGCSSSATPATAPPATVHATVAPTSTTPTTTITGTTGTATPRTAVTVASTRIVTSDPADYHVGSFGPGTPRRYHAHAVSFQTPSHNIRCTAIAGDEIVCETVQHTFAAAKRPADCTHNWLGSDVTLDTRGATLGVCAGNPIVQSDSNVLPYGHRLTVGGVSCVSETAHLACTEGRHGFTLDRARAALR